MSEMIYRSVQMTDAEQVADLMVLLGYPSTENQMRDRLALLLKDSDCYSCIAEHQDKIVGMIGGSIHAAFEHDGCYARVTVLVVETASRGKGIGRKLLSNFEEWAQEQGVSKISLTSGLPRKEAHEFYELCGYPKTGYRFTKKF
jgi:GNAT superfamily N-acetyltransferase